MQSNRERNLPEELIDEVRVTAVDEAIHIVPHETTDHRLVVCEFLWEEGKLKGATALRMRGLILVHEGAVHR
jgi:hypothetical protein